MEKAIDVYTIERGVKIWQKTFYENNYKTGKKGARIAAKVFARKFKNIEITIEERLFDNLAPIF